MGWLVSWVDALDLRRDERIIDFWEGVREILASSFEPLAGHEKKSDREFKRAWVKDRREGLLVLTSQRLVFLEPVYDGDGKRELEQPVEVSLLDVGRLWFEREPMDVPEKVHGYDTFVFSLKGVGGKREFLRFKGLVEEFCVRRREQLRSDTGHVVRFRVV